MAIAHCGESFKKKKSGSSTSETWRKGSLTQFNSYELPRQNFSLQYQYNINQISDENEEKYPFEWW